MAYAITLSIGIGLLLLSIFFFTTSLSFVKDGSYAIATVVDLEEVTDSDGTTFRAIFSYKTNLGQELIHRQKSSSSPSPWEIGETTTICYDPNHPEQAKILTSFGTFGLAIVLMAISMPCIVVSGGYYFTKSILQSYHVH
jgi:hypothetical protein